MAEDDAQERYKAFISYSQKDSAEARKVQSWLESFRLPKANAAPSKDGRRLGRIFRDKTDLTASPEVWPELKGKIAASEYLIVLCSPNAAQSEWVDKEIRHFRATGRADKVLALIIAGMPNSGDEATECFPPAFREVEPLAANLVSDGRTSALTRLAAGLASVPFDALWQRERRREHRRVALMSAATVVFAALAVAAVAFAISAERQRVAAARSQAIAQDALRETVDKFTAEQFREDAALDPLQQTVLDGLLPIYDRALEDARGDPVATADYARALDRIASLRSSSVSMQAANEAYVVALDALNQPFDRADAEEIIAPVRGRIAMNYVVQLLSYGDYPEAARVLRLKGVTTVASSEDLDCLNFRIAGLNVGFDQVDLALADRALASSLIWEPSALQSQQNHIACLIDLATAYRLNGEFAAAREAATAADRATSAALEAKPRSTAFRSLDTERYLMRTRLAYADRGDLTDDQADTTEDEPAAYVTAARQALDDTRAALAVAETLSPESRLVASRRLDFDLMRFRFKALDVVEDEATPSILEPEGVEAVLDVFENLIERDPNATALELYYNDELERILSILGQGELEPVEEQTYCQALNKRALEIFVAHPVSSVAARGVLTTLSCTERFIAVITDAERVGRINTESANELRERTHRELQQQLLTVLTGLEVPSATRRHALREYFQHMVLLMPSYDWALLDLIAQVDHETKTAPQSLRFTWLGTLLRAIERNRRLENPALDGRAPCLAHSEAQQRLCDIVTASGTDPYAGSVHFLDPLTSARLSGTIGATHFAGLLSASEPVEIAYLDGERVRTINDTAWSAATGASDPVLQLYDREAQAATPFLKAALERGLSLQDAHAYLRYGPSAMTEREFNEEGVEHWWNSAAQAGLIDWLRSNKERFGSTPTLFEIERKTDTLKDSDWAAYQDNETVVDMSDEELLQEKVVILLEGKNVFGDRVYTYLELSLSELIRLREEMRARREFIPADFGNVVAAGMGRPSRETRAFLADEQNMLDVPKSISESWGREQQRFSSFSAQGEP